MSKNSKDFDRQLKTDKRETYEKNKVYEQNKVITYSNIEQKIHGINTTGTVMLRLVMVLGVFVFLLICADEYLFNIEPALFRRILFGAGFIIVICIAVSLVIWISNILTVFIIDSKGNLYRLRTSVYWYKVRDKMYLINPVGHVRGRFARFIYMINNIKLVFDTVIDDSTYDEFISLGKMVRIKEINNVKTGKKTISFDCITEREDGEKKKKIRLMRVFERDNYFINYLKTYEKKGIKAASNIPFGKPASVKELFDISPDSVDKHVKKLKQFFFNWTCICGWTGDFFILGNRSVIKNVMIIYLFVLIIYIVARITDMIIILVKKEDE